MADSPELSKGVCVTVRLLRQAGLMPELDGELLKADPALLDKFSERRVEHQESVLARLTACFLALGQQEAAKHPRCGNCTTALREFETVLDLAKRPNWPSATGECVDARTCPCCASFGALQSALVAAKCCAVLDHVGESARRTRRSQKRERSAPRSDAAASIALLYVEALCVEAVANARRNAGAGATWNLNKAKEAEAEAKAKAWQSISDNRDWRGRINMRFRKLIPVLESLDTVKTVRYEDGDRSEQAQFFVTFADIKGDERTLGTSGELLHGAVRAELDPVDEPRDGDG